MLSYINNHWKGLHSFRKSIGLNIVLFNSVIIIFLKQLISWFEVHRQIPPVVFIVCLLIACLIILLWQTIGAFRSASISIRQNGSSAHFYCVLAVMLVSATFVLGSFATLSGGSIDYRQAAVDAYTPPEKQFLLSQSRTGVLSFTGDIGRGATAALREAAQELSAGTQLTINSWGGLIVEARGMAKVVKEFGLSTHVVERCYSACTLVFIAGSKRSLGPQGELGFHQYNVYAQLPLPWIKPGAEQEKDAALFREKHVADWFLKKAYSTPHQSIWVPQRDELTAAGVIDTK